MEGLRLSHEEARGSVATLLNAGVTGCSAAW